MECGSYAHVYSHLGAPAMVLRVIKPKIRTMEELQLPPVIKDIALSHRGLTLVTGTTGSGKSTMLAAMIDLINKLLPLQDHHDRGSGRVHAYQPEGPDLSGRGRAGHVDVRERAASGLAAGSRRDLCGRVALRARSCGWPFVPPIPAFAKRMSMRPNSEQQTATASLTSSDRVTSIATARTRNPAAARRADSRSRRSTWLSPNTTEAPSWTKRSAVASPMPAAAPVINATLPSRRLPIGVTSGNRCDRCGSVASLLAQHDIPAERGMRRCGETAPRIGPLPQGREPRNLRQWPTMCDLPRAPISVLTRSCDLNSWQTRMQHSQEFPWPPIDQKTTVAFRFMLRLAILMLIIQPGRGVGANLPGPAASHERRLYVAVPGIRNYLDYGGHGLLVYDIDHGHRLIKRIPTAGLDAKGVPNNVKGICASALTKRVYISTIQQLMCLD